MRSHFIIRNHCIKSRTKGKVGFGNRPDEDASGRGPSTKDNSSRGVKEAGHPDVPKMDTSFSKLGAPAALLFCELCDEIAGCGQGQPCYFGELARK